MKLQITLVILFISLFFNNIYAENIAFDPCRQAQEQAKDVLICQGRALAAKDDLNGALMLFKQAEAQSTDPFDQTVASMFVSSTLKALKQYEQAIASYQHTATLAKASKSVVYERASYLTIGNIYAIHQKFDLALAQYQLSNKLDANDNERGESNERIAFAYHQMNQHELALEYQLKTYLMYSAVGTLDEHAYSGIELGRYYLLAKNYSNAENILNKMIKFAKDQGGAYYEAKASYVLARVKTEMGDKVAANTLIDQAKTIAKNTQDSALETEIKLETQDLL